MYIPVYCIEDVYELCEAAYDHGFDDGIDSVPPPADLGDFAWAYLAGYEDGKASR